MSQIQANINSPHFGNLYYFKVPQGWYEGFYQAAKESAQQLNAKELYHDNQLAKGGANELVTKPIPNIKGYKWLGIRTPTTTKPTSSRFELAAIKDDSLNIRNFLTLYENFLSDDTDNHWMVSWLKQLKTNIDNLNNSHIKPWCYSENCDKSDWELIVNSFQYQENDNKETELVLKLDKPSISVYDSLHPFPEQKSSSTFSATA
jgi:hypothetical protein